MSVSIQPAGNYAGLIAGSFAHVEIAYIAGVGAVLDLPDGSAIHLTEFGALVRTPGTSPNRFIPYSSILEIRGAKLPQPAPDDGQMHD